MSHSQRELFETTPPVWELDDQQHVRLARVVFAEGLDGEYDYRVPAKLVDEVQAGKRLRVPLGRGNRLREAYCVDVRSTLVERPDRWKEVHAVIDPLPLLSAAMLRLTGWMAQYYVSSWGRVLESVLPAGVRSQAGTRLRTYYRVPQRVAARWHQLKLPAKQAAILRVLVGSTQPLTGPELQQQAACTAAPIRTLLKKGLLETLQQRVQSELEPHAPKDAAEELELHSNQQQALDAIVHSLKTGEHRTFVLHGVTGSGKTEVYIKAIEEMLGFGRQAIVLVPEISLTPQTQRRFRARFSEVAVLHSHLTDSERNWHWQRIARGEVQVVVGARSAIFAPTPHLGLIVLDEEHDGSFKQDTLPRYHARDVARYRAQAESIPLVLGSATPSLETWQMASQGEATLLSMPNRILDLPLPDVVTVDLRQEMQKFHRRTPLSRRLQQAIKQALTQGEQVILLLNRRGYSTHIQCPACGYVAKCPHCDIALTHHREGAKAVCHYCDFLIQAPPVCPECRFEGIRYSGLGTQRLEDEVRRAFPTASIVRMDSDTMRKPGSHEDSLSRFRRGEVQILLGTQMIAKGLDFPNVTVVGVINADTALHLPDFRAAERTFQLVTQVAGRTGRGEKGGRVFVQTSSPDHPAIVAAERHDYERFAKGELPIRQAFGYPPFGRMVRVIVRGPVESVVEGFAQEVVNALQPLEASCSGFRVLGPAPAPMARLRDNYRYHLFVHADEMELVKQKLREIQASAKLPDRLQWQADVDPLDML